RPLTHTDQGWIWKRATIKLPMFSAGEGEKVLCEGEKACIAASESYHAHCWHGGTNSITKTDFEGVGNDWLFWPDNDLPGWVAMQSIALMYNINPRFITAPRNSEKGYDAADGDAGEAVRLTDLTQVKNPLTGEVERWLTLKDGRVNVSKEPPTPEPVTPRFFVPLGFDKQSMSVYYYFYIRGKNKAVAFSAAQLLQKSALYDLNPDANYWISRYGEGKKIDTDQAATHLMNVCQAVGLFSPDKIRTRGAWMDRGRVVLHVGPYLIVDGQRTDIAELDTEYVYEWRDDLHYEPGAPLTNDKAREFCDMLKLYNWEREVNAELLAGWCAIAPLCGALPWRPHIWITGSSGTGKTKLMKDTILPLMSSIAVTPEGESTEAGIRQHLDGDALPVLFDEAESENRRSQERMEGILNLMRSASSGKSGQILKGSSSHHARSFRVRSCFGFASIVYQATKKADRSR
ncbi:MAG TPA: hypothetical protein VKP88_00555, partial [Candidatus Paceibacterota bacterium]|nr:hypothetical protein [Candidatus Paceibacterota bacterium]